MYQIYEYVDEFSIKEPYGEDIVSISGNIIKYK